MASCVVGLLAGVGLAQVQLPDAPGKDETVRLCGTCHEAERAASVRLTREGWQDTIAKMVDLGAKGSDEELAKVLDYLAEHFKGEAPRPLNLNTRHRDRAREHRGTAAEGIGGVDCAPEEGRSVQVAG